MAEASFTIGTYSLLNINIQPEKVSGQGGPFYPQLTFPLTINFHSREIEEGRQKFLKHYTLLELWGNLFISGEIRIMIGKFRSEPILCRSLERGNRSSYTITVPLDFFRIEKIESLREGNISFWFGFEVLIAEHPKIPSTERRIDERIEKIHKSFSELSIEVPQSHWIEKVLPGLGYGKYKVVEIPIPEKVIPEIYQRALDELIRAEKYFKEGDYDKVVVHCRNAIQLIPKVLPVKLSHREERERQFFKVKVEEFLKQHFQDLEESKTDALKEFISSLWKLCSISAHPSSPYYFNRADAEAIFIITSSLISYIGKIIKQKEEK